MNSDVRVEISLDILRHYLMQMVGMWFDEHDVEAEEIQEYKNGVDEMRKHIIAHKDESYVRLGFAHLVGSNEITPKMWDFLEGCCNYSFVEYEFKEIVAYAYQTLWPDTAPEEAMHGYQVELIKTGMDPRVWWSTRDKLNPEFRGQI